MNNGSGKSPTNFLSIFKVFKFNCVKGGAQQLKQLPQQHLNYQDWCQGGS